MLRKPIFYFVFLIAMLLVSNCGPGATAAPTLIPTLEPTLVPTLTLTLVPTLVPTLEPTLEPTLVPTLETPATSAPLPIITTLALYNKTNGCTKYPENAAGEIEYQSWMQTGFRGTLKLSGLDPKQPYVFTINGVKEDPRGNDLLMDGCNTPKGKLEGYCDFKFQANDQGGITKQITQVLPQGLYRIKFFIKKDEQRENYCIVLYNDDNTLEFEIK